MPTPEEIQQLDREHLARAAQIEAERDELLEAVGVLTVERDNAIQQGDIAREELDKADGDIRALEIDVADVTAERDQALLRVEELEAELVDWHGTRGLDMENPNDSAIVPDWNASPRGGVNPNA